MLTLLGTTLTNPALGDLGDTPPGNFAGGLLNTAISLAFVAGIILFLFLLLTGAIMWMTSGGDKGKYETAKARITQAAVGLFILFLLFVIINLVGCIFGVNLLQFEFGELNVSFTGSPVCGGGSSIPGGS